MNRSPMSGHHNCMQPKTLLHQRPDRTIFHILIITIASTSAPAPDRSFDLSHNYQRQYMYVCVRFHLPLTTFYCAPRNTRKTFARRSTHTRTAISNYAVYSRSITAPLLPHSHRDHITRVGNYYSPAESVLITKKKPDRMRDLGVVVVLVVPVDTCAVPLPRPVLNGLAAASGALHKQSKTHTHSPFRVDAIRMADSNAISQVHTSCLISSIR